MTLDTVVKAVTDAAAVAGGGFVDMPNQRIAVRHRSPIEEPEDLAEDDRRVPQRSAASAGRRGRRRDRLPAADRRRRDQRRRRACLLIVEKQPTGNTLEVTRNVEKALEALRAGPEGRRRSTRPSSARRRSSSGRSTTSVRRCSSAACWSSSSWSSFLFDWRTALISLTAIPLSLIAATLVLRLLGRDASTRWSWRAW